MDKAALLQTIADDIEKHPLYPTVTHSVPGEGSPDAEIMFVGEAPGAQEDLQGRPFVGPSGKFLDQMLQSINLNRADVFITSILKHRPPNNRDPEKSEIVSSYRWLRQQIEVIDPKIIVTLGRYSMSVFLPDIGKISAVHGRTFRKPDGRIYVPFFHPAAGLHQASLKSTIEADFKKLPKIIALIKQPS